MAVLSQTQARPYAKAIFLFALEHQTLELWSRFLKRAVEISGYPEIRPLLNHPKVPVDQFLDLFCTLLQEERNSETDAFLRILIEKRRLSLLPAIEALFQDLCDEHAQRLKVTVISTFEFSEEQHQCLMVALEKRFQKQVVIHYQIDPSLLGGAIVQVGDLRIDGSGRGRLNQLKNYLKEQTICL